MTHHDSVCVQLHGSTALAEILGLKMHYRGVKTKRKPKRSGGSS